MNCWLICREEINRKIYGFIGKKGVSISGAPFIFTDYKSVFSFIFKVLAHTKNQASSLLHRLALLGQNNIETIAITQLGEWCCISAVRTQRKNAQE